MTMRPLYPCGKPCPTGIHNEILKKLTLFSASINGIMEAKASNLFNRIENSITFAGKIVIDDYAKDGGEEPFTKMHRVLIANP